VIQKPGVLSTLFGEHIEIPDLGPYDVEYEVKVVGLNFKVSQNILSDLMKQYE
jgi:hypothetical protein